MTDLTRRKAIASTGAAALAGLLPATAYGKDQPRNVLDHVAPELRAVLERLSAMMGATGEQPVFSAETLPAIRAGGAASNLVPPPIASPAWEKVTIAGPDRTRLDLYVVNKSPGASKPAILHTHGGGYIIGKAETDLRNLQGIAAELDCVIVSVDYRLAPETTWRGSVEDNYAGLKWLHGNAGVLGVDTGRIAVMGESAGGGHAALLAQVAHDRGEVPICFQSLVYPMLDDRTGTRVVPPWPVGELVWTAASNRFGWESFLGMEPGTAAVPVEAVPARRASLAGLPPAWIGVGALDLFVDEDVDYAQRLMADGVEVQLLVMPGAFHGFDLMGQGTRIGDRFTDSKLFALARAFGVERRKA